MTKPTFQSLLLGDPGVLLLGDHRQMVVTPGLLADIQKGVEDRLGAKASEYLYSAGSIWAGREIRRMRSASDNLGPKELVRIFCLHATAIGWGDWQLETLQEQEKGMIITVKRSPFAHAYGQSDEPVCHVMAGAIAGITEVVFRVPATCTELHCLAQGASNCQFSAVGDDLAKGDSWDW